MCKLHRWKILGGTGHEIKNFSDNNDAPLNTTVQTWVSVLLSAQAQDLPVDLWVDMNECSSGSQWTHYGAPSGLGLRLMGVKIAK